jgi:hypothetical protein
MEKNVQDMILRANQRKADETCRGARRGRRQSSGKGEGVCESDWGYLINEEILDPWSTARPTPDHTFFDRFLHNILNL